MPETQNNFIYYLTDTLDLYFYITDENDALISGDDWDDVIITIKDNFNATTPEIVLADKAGEFTTYQEGVTPGNVHFFITAAEMALITKGTWEYRVIISKDVVGELPAEQITAARGNVYAI
jgi:hypothetical protein